MNTMNKSSLNSTKFSTSRIMEIVWIFLICDNSSGEYFLKYYFLITSFSKIMPNFCQHVILFTMISDVFLWVLTYVCWFLAINLTNFDLTLLKFHIRTDNNLHGWLIFLFRTYVPNSWAWYVLLFENILSGGAKVI